MLYHSKLIFKTFSKVERLIFTAAFIIFIAASFFIILSFFNQETVSLAVKGGRYIEGVVGQPTFINPVLINGNDADRDLATIIFDNLLDLAESYKMNADGKIWNVRLKEGIRWHDGRPIVSDDVIFTVNAIQNPDILSVALADWQGVAAERVSEREIQFSLPSPYMFFPNTLKKLRPIPKHLFENIPPANFKLSNYNLEPIGSGPFKFDSFEKQSSGFITEYRLVRNEEYVNDKPYLEEIIFKFYTDSDKVRQAFESGQIDGFGDADQKQIFKLNLSSQISKIPTARYYAVFFNPYSHSALKEKNVRLALDYAIDKKQILEKIFNNQAAIASGPLIEGMKGYAADGALARNFSLEKAQELLETNGWQKDIQGIRTKKISKKETLRLEFKLIVPQAPFLTETAKMIQSYWSPLGVKLEIVSMPAIDINQEIIKTRNYEMILFGNIFSDNANPDLFSFWHSSERFSPGLNLAMYENKNADYLIESIRKNPDEGKRQKDLSSLQSLIIQDAPAIFLFAPYYFYVSKNWLRGFKTEIISLPSDRFNDIEKWYVKTVRVFK